MAIRLAKDLLKDENKDRASAFHIVFTENQTYDLDELAALHTRTDSLSALVIEVRNEAEIAKKVLAAMRETLSRRITTTLGTDEVRDGILDIVAQIFSKYKALGLTGDYDSNALPYEGYKELKDRLNAYLRSIYENTHIQYGISVNGKETTITYHFASDEDLDASFTEFYALYAEEYNKELTDVEEGGLAISDTGDQQLRAKTADFEKYLLDDSKELKPKSRPADSQDPGTYLTNKRPVIMWEEGTDDTKTEDISSDVYDEINALTKRMAEKDAKIAELTENVGTLMAALEKLSSFMGMNVVQSLLDAAYDTKSIPTAKAIVEYINTHVITEDNYDFTSEEKAIIGVFTASYDTDVIYATNGAVLTTELDNMEILEYTPHD